MGINKQSLIRVKIRKRGKFIPNKGKHSPNSESGSKIRNLNIETIPKHEMWKFGNSEQPN